MGDTLRLAVGIMGNAASLLLFSAPILTFYRVVRKKSTEEFSCVPYIIALLNCLLYTWYGLPVVSYRWENFPVIKVAITVIPVILVFCITATISAFALHDHRHRKIFVGSVALAASKKVIKTKSVEFMPFYLSFFSFLASSIWMAYGLLSHDLFLASPNLVGSPLGIVQLVLYCKYRKTGIMEAPHKWDLEKNEEKSKKLQLVINDSTNDRRYILRIHKLEKCQPAFTVQNPDESEP
uniref:Bidirectional sugar transporter SWEET n=1 Tax=Salix viminalis TaxID=40686 RepID=A0A6N2KFX7_SALVM